ncbi:MAG: glucosaminidase domain-containing protein [Treponema sp.]|nr:glucosaminidase domain-containing protein [Treponema sp.]
MIKKGLFLIFLAGFILINGFSQSPDTDELLEKIIRAIREELSPSGQGKPVPLTWDIVKVIKDSKKEDILKELKYFLSADSTLESRPRDINSNSGRLIIDYGDTITLKKISSTSMGECTDYDFSNKNEEKITIKFPERSIVFIRNIQTGLFNAGYINSESKSESDDQFKFKDQPPYLCIYFDQQGVISPYDKPQVSQSAYNEPAGRNFPRSYNEVCADQIPVFIMSRGTLNRDAVVSYIMSKNPSMTRNQITGLINEYIGEAAREGVNHDIAIAQMCYATNFLTNRKLLDTYNFAGLNADNGISVRYGGRHASMQEGVWAHIQHLKGYASRECPKREIVNRRYEYLKSGGILGNVETLEELFTTWSPYNSNNYRNAIINTLNDLYRLSSKLI